MAGTIIRKIAKFGLWTISILILLLLAAYLVMLNHAEDILQSIVSYESKGKYSLHIGKLKFNPFKRRIDLLNAELRTNLVKRREASIDFKGKQITLQLAHIRSLIFGRKLEVDSILFESPEITLRQPLKADVKNNRKITIQQALGNVYLKLENVFKVMYVKRGEINDGKLIIHDPANPKLPTTLESIYFLLEQLNVRQDGKNDDNKFLFSDNILFKMGPQTIQLPDGQNSITFKQFTLSTKYKFIELDSSYITGSSKTFLEDKYKVFNNKLKIVNLDFGSLYSQNIIKADSVYCTDPILTLELSRNKKDIRKKRKEKKEQPFNSDSLQHAIRAVTGDVLISYLGVINGDISVAYTLDNKTHIFSTPRSNFQVFDLHASGSGNNPVTVSRIDFDIKNYKGFSPDSTYAIRFDSMRLLTHRFILWNAGMQPVNRKTMSSWQDISVNRFELSYVDWLTLLFERRLTAKQALLQGASVTIRAIPDKAKQDTSGASMISVLNDLHKSFNINEIIISEADIDYALKNNLSFKLNNAFVKLNLPALLQSSEKKDIPNSLKELFADKATIKAKKFTADAEAMRFTENKNAWDIKKLQFRSNKGSTINASDVYLENPEEASGHFSADALRWKNAKVQIQSEAPAAKGKKMNIAVNNVDLQQTDLSFVKDDKKITTYIEEVKSSALKIGAKVLIKDLRLNGRDLHYISKTDSAFTHRYYCKEDGSFYIAAPEFYHTKARSNLSFLANDVTGRAVFNGIVDENENLQLYSLNISQPAVVSTKFNPNIEWNFKGSNLHFNNIHIAKSNISTGDILANGFIFSHKKNDTINLEGNLSALQLQHLTLKKNPYENIQDFLRDNQRLRIADLSLTHTTAENKISFQHLYFDKGRLTADSVAIIPLKDREAFNLSNQFQKDHILAIFKNVTADGIDLPGYVADNKLNIKSLHLNDPYIDVYRDKRLPFKEGIIKPLPVNMLAPIPIALYLDSLYFNRGDVTYTETSDKTLKTGYITFKHLNATIAHIKNTDIQPEDSLNLKARTYLMDTTLLVLKMRESYYDSLAGFLMTVNVEPMQLSVLNSIFIPIASVNITSGKMDHLDMRAVGREYLAFGKMNFLYHDLKFKVLQKGELAKTTFLTRIATFIANGFIVRKNNTKREGRIFFERNRERSIFNYWVKMTMSGLISSTGAKSTRKMERKYKKQLKKQDLPPVNLE